MWIASKYGFFSIVNKAWSRKSGPGFGVMSHLPVSEWHIRARARGDLVSLIDAIGWSNKPTIHETKDADYRFRVVLKSESNLEEVFSTLCDSIDYDNFKGMIHDNKDQADKSGPYMQVWSTMAAYQDRRHPRPKGEWAFEEDLNPGTPLPKPYPAVRANKLLKLDGSPQPEDEPAPPRRKRKR